MKTQGAVQAHASLDKAPTAADLLSASGVTLQTLPVGGTVSMELTCTVD